MKKDSKHEILDKAKIELLKSLKHLKYSYNKTRKISLNQKRLENEQVLESFEGLASRFSRTSDIFISRYLRTFILIREPGFRGSLLDYLNQAEKLGLIENATLWAEIREIRNSASHKYSFTDLVVFFGRLVELTPHLLKLKDSFT